MHRSPFRPRRGVPGLLAAALLLGAPATAQECAGLPTFARNLTAAAERGGTSGGTRTGVRLGYRLTENVSYAVSLARIEFAPVPYWSWDTHSYEPVRRSIEVEPGYSIGGDVGFEAFIVGVPVCSSIGVQYAGYEPFPKLDPHWWAPEQSSTTLVPIGASLGRSAYLTPSVVVTPFGGLEFVLVHGLDGYEVAAFPEMNAQAGLGLLVGPLHATASIHRWILDDPVFSAPTTYYNGGYSPEEGRSAFVWTIRTGWRF
jgi:hypothetical protein